MPPRPSAAFAWHRCPNCTQSTPSRLPMRALSTNTPSHSTPSTTTTRFRTSTPLSPSLINPSNASPSDSPSKDTTNLSAPKPIPPTSPRYIDIPASLQPDVIRRPFVKGHLPIARDIFKPKPGRLGQLTTSQITDPPESTRKERIRGPAAAAQANRNAYLTRLAEIRRNNLRAGIKQLSKRRDRHNASLQAHAESKIAEREALLAMPQREDELLTSTSITSVLTAPLKQRTGILPDPDRAGRMAEKRARVAAIEEKKAQRTQGALHELFVQARSFIVDEEQLDKEIESEFGTQKEPRTWKDGEVSVWGEGPPPTLQSMVEQAGRASGPVSKIPNNDDVDARERLMKHRLGRIAEELTGGKMA